MVSFGAIAKRLPSGGAEWVYSSEICRRARTLYSRRRSFLLHASTHPATTPHMENQLKSSSNSEWTCFLGSFLTCCGHNSINRPWKYTYAISFPCKKSSSFSWNARKWCRYRRFWNKWLFSREFVRKLGSCWALFPNVDGRSSLRVEFWAWLIENEIKERPFFYRVRYNLICRKQG